MKSVADLIANGSSQGAQGALREALDSLGVPSRFTFDGKRYVLTVEEMTAMYQREYLMDRGLLIATLLELPVDVMLNSFQTCIMQAVAKFQLGLKPSTKTQQSSILSSRNDIYIYSNCTFNIQPNF